MKDYEIIYNLITNNNIQQAIEKLNDKNNGLSEIDYIYLYILLLLQINQFEEAEKTLNNVLSSSNDERLIKLKYFLQTIENTPKINSANLRLLNLVCGQTYHKEWINIDISSHSEYVLAHDLTKEIPFNDNIFDVVYHSHILEHFPKNYAHKFIKECYRVLKPGGIIRVVVPDLEGIVKEYILNLEQALSGDPIAQEKYNWIMLELYDQTVRNQSGGEMLHYLVQDNLIIKDYIISRIGAEAINIINNKDSINKNLQFRKNDTELSAEEIGNFRKSGEIHQWMYDRYSLNKLLKECGFHEIQIKKYNESLIPDFNLYCLDITPEGLQRKPDSLYIEAIK